jgi:hypothetical protein
LGILQTPKLQDPARGAGWVSSGATEELCAILAGPPWRKSQAEIFGLERFWIVNVLFWPRDDKGRIEPRERPERRSPRDPREKFLEWWRRKGASRCQAETLWERLQARKQEAGHVQHGRPRS